MTSPCAAFAAQLFSHTQYCHAASGKDPLALPSWWTSERKTRTVCAIHFRSVGPLLPKLRLNPGSHAADAEAFEPSKAVIKSGSMPMVESSMHGSSINARAATGPGIGRSLNAKMFGTSIPPLSRRCNPTIRTGFERRHSILKLSGANPIGSLSLRNSKSARSCCAKFLTGNTWRSSFSISLPASARLDRLLASELPVSRSQLNAFHQAGLLKTNPDPRRYPGAADQKRYLRNGGFVWSGRQGVGVETAGHWPKESTHTLIRTGKRCSGRQRPMAVINVHK
jgi:hypothetical protein